MKKFQEWWGSDFFRTPGSGAFATRGFVGANISFAGDIVTKDLTFPFCVESKNEEGWELSQLLTAPKNKLQKWWTQTCSECPAGSVPLLVFTRNHTPEFFMVPWDVWSGDCFGSDPTVIRFEMERGSVAIGLLTTLLSTDKEFWLNAVTTIRLGPDPKDPAKEKAKAEKSFDKVFDDA